MFWKEDEDFEFVVMRDAALGSMFVPLPQPATQRPTPTPSFEQTIKYPRAPTEKQSYKHGENPVVCVVRNLSTSELPRNKPHNKSGNLLSVSPPRFSLPD